MFGSIETIQLIALLTDLSYVLFIRRQSKSPVKLRIAQRINDLILYYVICLN